MIDIRLDHAEMWNACSVGVTRQIVSVRQGFNAMKNDIPSNFQTNIEGAIAEACFAKYLGVYWSCSVNTFKDPDVGEWQVRGTTCPTGHLIVRRDDPDDEPIAFLVTHDKGATLRGWLYIREAKVQKYWNAARTSWWVPQSDLRAFAPDVSTPKGEPYHVDGLHDEAADARRH